jgi:1,4-alpha-glucan branching enzyme
MKPKTTRTSNHPARKKTGTSETPEHPAPIKKVYLKTRDTCKVTFRLPAEIAGGAERVCIVGDFNNWDVQASPMKKLKDGAHTITLDLEKGKEYQYRYLIDGVIWENDRSADKYVSSPYPGCDNSVVTI